MYEFLITAAIFSLIISAAALFITGKKAGGSAVKWKRATAVSFALVFALAIYSPDPAAGNISTGGGSQAPPQQEEATAEAETESTPSLDAESDTVKDSGNSGNEETKKRQETSSKKESAAPEAKKGGSSSSSGSASGKKPTSKSAKPSKEASVTVYYTRTGKKYHTKKCGNGTYMPCTLKSAKSRGLAPCKKCF